MKVPKGWRHLRMNEAGAVEGGRQRSPHLTQGQLRPYLRVANVLDGWIDTTDVLQMPFTDTEFEKFRLEEGDILLNEGQSLDLCGRSAIYHGDPPQCCYQNTLIRFRPSLETHGPYAFALFQYFLESGVFAAIASQTTSIAHLGVNRFATLRGLFPPLHEQRRIAEIIGTWDRAIETQQKLIAAKTNRLHSLRHQLLTSTKRFPEFKDKWKTQNLERFFKPISDRNKDVKEQLVLSCTKTAGIMRQQDRFGRRIASKNTTNYKVVLRGDLVYDPMLLWDGSIGFVNCANRGIVSPAYSTLRPQSRVHSDFFSHLFQWEVMATKFKLISRGTNKRRQKAPVEDFLSISLPLPSFDEQQRITSTLNVCRQEIALESQKLEAFQQQKRGLMHKLLNGEIRVKNS